MFEYDLMKYPVTINSTRIYEKLDIVDTIIKEFNRAKFYTYNLFFLKETDPSKFKDKYGEESIYNIVKDKFKFDTYYTNSIVNEAKGVLSSQLELKKLYISQKKEKIKSIEKSIKDLEKKLKNYNETLNNLHIYQKALKENKKYKFKAKGLNNISLSKEDKYKIIVRNFKLSKEYGLYSFEYDYLLPKIKSIKNQISMKIYFLNNTKESLKNLDNLKHVVFGKDNKNKVIDKSKKYKEFKISGRSDAGYGNFIFKATPKIVNEKLFFDIEVNFPQKIRTFRNIEFPYRGENLKEALKIHMPICFGFTRKVDGHNRTYYNFKVSFDLAKTCKLNDYTQNGVFGMDFNFKHIDLTETDSKGNLIFFKTFEYKITNNSKENEESLREVLNEIGKLVASKHKPLVIEDLDTTKSKAKSTYRDKTLNRTFHMLPYERYIQMTKYIGIKYGFNVILVNPAFTSVIGLLKYSYQKKLNSHISASYVIARRGMGFKEQIPLYYKTLIDEELKTKHHWSKWNKINKENNKLIKEQKKKDKKNKEYHRYSKSILLKHNQKKDYYKVKKKNKFKEKEDNSS